MKLTKVNFKTVSNYLRFLNLYDRMHYKEILSAIEVQEDYIILKL